MSSSSSACASRPTTTSSSFVVEDAYPPTVTLSIRLACALPDIATSAIEDVHAAYASPVIAELAPAPVISPFEKTPPLIAALVPSVTPPSPTCTPKLNPVPEDGMSTNVVIACFNESRLPADRIVRVLPSDDTVTTVAPLPTSSVSPDAIVIPLKTRQSASSIPASAIARASTDFTNRRFTAVS